MSQEQEVGAAAASERVPTPAERTDPVRVQAPTGQAPTGQALSGRGAVYTYSIMYNVPQGFEEQKPYVVAIVQLAEGPRVTAQLTDVAHDAVTIGMAVEMVTRKLREEGDEGQIIYGYKFRPVLSF